MQKILITGSSSYIGMTLVNYLHSKNYQMVLAYRNYDNIKQFANLKNIELVEWDLNYPITSPNLLNYFKNPTILIHLAWQDLPNYQSNHHIDINYKNSYLFIDKLLSDGLTNINVIGTCFEYGKTEGCVSEPMVVEPSTVYGKAKTMLYSDLLSLRLNYKFNLKWLRPFYISHSYTNTRDLFSMLNKAKETKKLKISVAKVERDYLDVNTLVEYIYKLSILEKNIGIVNCCSGKAISLKNLVETFCEANNICLELDQNYRVKDYEPIAFWGDRRKLDRFI